jgi:hypothetical protein
MKIALGLMLLATTAPASCNPASEGATDFKLGDGGVWVGNSEAGVLIDDSSDLPGGEALPELPPMEMLCMLLPGDWGMKNDYETMIGTWFDDVEDPRFLGPADPKSKYIDSEGGRLSYSYRKPGTKDEKVSISLTFEKVIVLAAEGAERVGENMEVKFGSGMDGVMLKGPAGLAASGAVWPDPMFLNRVTAQGLDVQPLCWDPYARWSDTNHWVDCPWCHKLGTDFLLCGAADPRTCFQGH